MDILNIQKSITFHILTGTATCFQNIFLLVGLIIKNFQQKYPSPFKNKNFAPCVHSKQDCVSFLFYASLPWGKSFSQCLNSKAQSVTPVCSLVSYYKASSLDMKSEKAGVTFYLTETIRFFSPPNGDLCKTFPFNMSLWELPQNFSRIVLQFLPFGTISPHKTLPPILCGFGSYMRNFPLIIFCQTF